LLVRPEQRGGGRRSGVPVPRNWVHSCTPVRGRAWPAVRPPCRRVQDAEFVPATVRLAPEPCAVPDSWATSARVEPVSWW